jgi:TetR/AcrR family transcriptional regulator, regulator of biofilm formation and stress response
MAKRAPAVRSAARTTRLRRRLQKAEPLPRREVILDAALALIAERGTEQLTHRSVAEEAGVPLGSTTYYFASRDELVREAFRRYVVRVLDLLGEMSREQRPRDAAGLVELLVEIARREVSGGLRWTVIVEYELVLRAARDPELVADYHGYERALASGLAEVLETLGAPQPFDSARTLIALVRGFEMDGLTRPDADPEDLRRRLGPVVELVLRRPNPRAKEKP